MNLFAVSTHKEHSTMAKIAMKNLLELHYEAIKYLLTFSMSQLRNSRTQ